MKRPFLFSLLLIPLLLIAIGCFDSPPQAGPGGLPPQPDDGYLFCFWNVENLFDERDDGRTGPGDKTYDKRFSDDPELVNKKLSHLVKVLTTMNDGRGPDILALAEVEGEHITQRLKEALNRKIGNRAMPYQHIAYKNPKGGRHIATVVISRIPILSNRSRILKSRYRILEAHLDGGGHPLVVVASHWSSRLSDRTGETRAKYAKAIYGRFNAIYKKNDKVDFLVCGDFNDNPTDASVVQHLHAVPNREDALQLENGQPRMLNLFADLHDEKSKGTLYYRGWHLYDQITVSPGLLDTRGWTCVPETAEIIQPKFMQNRNGKPRSFYPPTKTKGYGYSDHFPVAVRLKLQP